MDKRLKITIEGEGGSGKTTMLHLIASILSRAGCEVGCLDDGYIVVPDTTPQVTLPKLDRNVTIIAGKSRMTLEQYSDLAVRTANSMGSVEADFMHAALGAGTESGELLDIAKRQFAYGKPIDTAHAMEEIGDLMWYANLAVVKLGLMWEDVLEANIRKLEKRYPDLRFDADKAVNRDTDAERAALEGK